MHAWEHLWNEIDIKQAIKNVKKLIIKGLKLFKLGIFSTALVFLVQKSSHRPRKLFGMPNLAYLPPQCNFNWYLLIYIDNSGFPSVFGKFSPGLQSSL